MTAQPCDPASAIGPPAGSAAIGKIKPSAGAALFRGAAGSFLVQIGGLGAMFGSQVGLAHLLGAGAFGQYVYVIAWVNLLCVFGRCGLDVASLRFIAEYRSQARAGLMRGFVRHSIWLTASAATTIALLGLVALSIVASSTASPLFVLGLLGITLVPILSLQGLFAAQLRALKHVVLGQLPRQILSPLAIVVATYLAVAVTGHTLSAANALTWSVVINGGLTLLAGVITLRYLRADYGHATPDSDRRQWNSCSLALLFVAVVQLINLRVDVLMVGTLLSLKDAGIYTAAAQLSGLTTLGLVGVNAIAAPMIAELHAKGHRQEFQKFLRQAAGLIFLLTAPLAILLVFLGTPLLEVFGGEFAVAYPPLLILATGQALGTLAGPVGFLVIMTGNQREGAWILGASAALNVAMNLVLVPSFGLMGAATATALTTCFWNLLMLVFVVRRLQVNPTVFRFQVAR